MTLRDRVLDLHGHPGPCAQTRVDQVRIGRAGDERVGTGDDPGGDLEDLELQLVVDDRLQTERPPHAPEELVGLVDDLLRHLERLRQQRLSQNHRRVPGDHERGVQAVPLGLLDGSELVHLVDVGLVAPVHGQQLQGPSLLASVPIGLVRVVEEVHVVPGTEAVLLDGVRLGRGD